MLTVPKLDTQSFKEIYETMKRLMEMSETPPKADASYQDPGQTLLELFALLFDMQHYYMDFISGEHREKYAQLLGIYAAKMSYASTMLEIFNGIDVDVLPAGYTFYANNVPFETADRLEITKNAIISAKSVTPREQETELTLVFDKDLSECPVRFIYFKFDTPIEPLAYPMDSWNVKYLNAAYEWVEAEYFDKNVKQGFLSVKVDKPMSKKDDGYWLKLNMKTDFKVQPKIEFARINVVKASQVKTWCSYTDKKVNNCTFELDSYLALLESGEVEILGGTDNGYRELDKGEYDLVKYKNYGCAKCTIKSSQKYDDYRVLYYDCKFPGNRIMQTNGTPGQTIPLLADNLDEDNVEIMTSYELDGNTYWLSWKQVSNFYASSGTDRHYVVQNSSICFGNHERGEIPPVGSLKIISCKCSLGAAGNIRSGELNTKYAANILPSAGGENKQSGELKASVDTKAGKAVTLKDYEDILKDIPVLKLDKVNASTENTILKYITEEGKIEEKTETAICIYVKPISDKPAALLNEAYKKNIIAYLEQYRLITTKINIKDVSYEAFSIKLKAVYYPGYTDLEAEATVEKELRMIFPDESFKNGAAVEFSKRITYSEIYLIVRDISCVKRIESLCIYKGKEIQPEKEVNFIKPEPGQLLYLAKIMVISQNS